MEYLLSTLRDRICCIQAYCVYSAERSWLDLKMSGLWLYTICRSTGGSKRRNHRGICDYRSFKVQACVRVAANLGVDGAAPSFSLRLRELFLALNSSPSPFCCGHNYYIKCIWPPQNIERAPHLGRHQLRSSGGPGDP